jgi:hypothetical protein
MRPVLQLGRRWEAWRGSGRQFPWRQPLPGALTCSAVKGGTELGAEPLALDRLRALGNGAGSRADARHVMTNRRRLAALQRHSEDAPRRAGAERTRPVATLRESHPDAWVELWFARRRILQEARYQLSARNLELLTRPR